MGPFVNQNWVINFINLIHFGPPTFSLVILVLRHQLKQSSRLSFYISYCILDFIFMFFLDFFWGSKIYNNKDEGGTSKKEDVLLSHHWLRR